MVEPSRQSGNVCYHHEISEESRWILYAKLLASGYETDHDDTDKYVQGEVRRLLNKCKYDLEIPVEHCEAWMHNGKVTLCNNVMDECEKNVTNKFALCDGLRGAKLIGLDPPTTTTRAPCPTIPTTTVTTPAPFPTGTLLGGILLGMLIGVVLTLLLSCLCKNKSPDDNLNDLEVGGKKTKKKKKKSKNSKATTGGSGATGSGTKKTGSSSGTGKKTKNKKKGKKGKKGKKTTTNSGSGF